MNEKRSDLFDGRVRQTLDGLPDAPPPGSTFDAGRLWEQLRPELATPVAPVSQKAFKRRGAWWLLAAAVAGLVTVWLWYIPTDKPVAQTSKSVRPVVPQIADRLESHKDKQTEPESLSKANKPIADVVERRLKKSSNRSSSPTQPNAQPTFSPAPQPEETTAGAVAQTVEPPAAPLSAASSQTASVANATKRRFRVVHENELPAEDEAYQVRYRTQHFVRMGTSGQLSAAPDEGLPALRLPLSRKSTQ